MEKKLQIRYILNK